MKEYEPRLTHTDRIRQELDEILTKLENAVALNIGSQGMRGEAPKRSHWKAKRAVLDWHNKQIEAVLDRLLEHGEDFTTFGDTGRSVAVEYIEVERNKLMEQSDD